MTWTRTLQFGLNGESRAEYSLTLAVYSGQATVLEVAPETGAITTITGAGGLVSRSASETLKTDSDGQGQLQRDHQRS